MRIADLTVCTVYAMRCNSHSSTVPVLLLDTALWNHKWKALHTEDNKVRYIIAKAEVGTRVRSTSSGVVGLPVLKLENGYRNWTASDEDQRVVTSPAEILATAARQLGLDKASDLEFDGPYGELRHHLRTEVIVELANGRKASMEAVLDFVRPQVLINSWEGYAAHEAEEVRLRVEREKEWQVKRDQAKSQFEDFTTRVDTLVGEGDRGPWVEGRWGLQPSSKTSGRYEVSAELLEQLIALAEKGRDA
jgi:hypothetical protein